MVQKIKESQWEHELSNCWHTVKIYNRHSQIIYKVSQSVLTSQDTSMATALVDPVIESDDLSESQLLLGEEDKTGHESIIKNDN